ncbi:unnamed protein product [Polarella glacialis]|uniref:Uncharacterized protein n=1 Tax=Polarella glacialis TaxID=89957 RepID=A0A813KFE4_POLGL|nr:unnamed protein product [Polarella glacialis]CAE8697596.1 unnamed protein product [Polarella glacialis]
MQECFALDWSRAKVGRLVSEQERSAVQEIIQANYRRFLAMYRVLSANGVSGEAGFGISQIEAGDTMALGGLVDSTVTRISDVDRFFIASKVLAPDMKKRPNMLVNNEKVLNRHQLLELFLRVADQRFVQTGETPSIAEAMRRVLAGLEEAGQAKLSDLDNFLDAFHTDEVDDVFKMHTPMLQVLYERFSGRFTRPGQAKFMSLTEFQELLEISGSGVAFRMGMMTQPEEVLGTRFQEMTFLEFQHALGAAVFMKTGFVKEEMANLANAFIKTKLVKAMPPKKKLLSLKLVVSAVVSAGALAKSGG